MKSNTSNQETLSHSQIEENGQFDNFDISKKTQKTLKSLKINYLFPIQQRTYNEIFDGIDLIGRDRTGSGKTLAFTLPVLEKYRKKKLLKKRQDKYPLTLIIVPTRELAIQITRVYNELKNHGGEYRVLSVYGGVPIYEQIKVLKRGVDFVIGTPGRILDLLIRNILVCKNLLTFVLDETDQMLDFGFKEDIEKVLDFVRRDLRDDGRGIEDLQFLLFSATIPVWVDAIAAKFMTKDHIRVEMIKKFEIKTSKTVKHLSINFPDEEQKILSIADIVSVYGGSHSKTIIFTDKKVEANQILIKSNLKVEAQVLHGDIPQAQREITFQAFRESKIKCLVATNVAARGLDIPEIDLIIQLSPPNDIDSYIHRSGRTGRAGKAGVCITLFTNYQKGNLDKICYKAKIKIQKVHIPQVGDILRASGRDVGVSIDEVSEDVLPFFKDIVEDVFSRYEPIVALSRALAIISGYTEMFSTRSLLSSRENYITFCLKSDYLHTISDFWSLIKKYFKGDILVGIKNEVFEKDKIGVLFEIRKEFKDRIMEIGKDIEEYGVFVSCPKELPELEEESKDSLKDLFKSNNSKFRNGYGNNNRNNTYNRNNNSYGNNNNRNNYGNNFNRERVNNNNNYGNNSKRNNFGNDNFNRNNNNSYGNNNNNSYGNNNNNNYGSNNNSDRNSNFGNNNRNTNSVKNVNFNKNLNKFKVQGTQNQDNFKKPENSGNGSFKRRGFNISVLTQKKNNFQNKNNFGKFQKNNFSKKDNTKLFFSNLNFQVTEEDLNALIKKKGYSNFEVNLVLNKDGTSKGYAFISFFDEQGAKYALEDFKKGKIKGRSIKVDYADIRG